MQQNEPDIDYHIYKTYEILGLLGKGSYGQVYKVRQKKSNQILAIKKICDAYQNVTDAKRTYRQLNYLFQLSHPCIVKLFQVVPGYRRNGGHCRQSNTTRTDSMKGSYNQHQTGYNSQKTHDGINLNQTKTSKHVYAVFQFVQTDLSKALRRCVMQPIQRKYIAYQILHGMSYLHKSRLIHRDVKPSNILIDTNCDIKICDFGLCRLKQEKKTQQSQQNIITEYVASRWYRPPQILLGFSPCNQAIDMWGVGCVITQLILRTPIFQGQSTMDQLQKIFRIIGLPNQNEIAKLQTEHAKFLLRTFTFSRKNRPQKISEVLGQASDEQLDLIQRLLKFNPQDRLSAEQALNHKYFKQMQQMNYDLNNYNIPVKIIDHTEPSTHLQQFKNFISPVQNKTSPFDRTSNKNKQITLEQYQNLIEELQRATSRSSNRVFNGGYFKQSDEVIQLHQNTSSESGLKQKSTRESNFLLEHRKMQNQKQKNQVQETELIIQNYNKQKSCSSSQKNLKVNELMKGNRNVHSTLDNYYKSVNPNFETGNDLFLSCSKDKISLKNEWNKSMQDNLEQNYGIFFNPFQKQVHKKCLKTNKNPLQIPSHLQDLHLKRIIGRRISNNKQSSKLSNPKQSSKQSNPKQSSKQPNPKKKQKSIAKNSSKNTENSLHQHLDQTKNKYNSYGTLNSYSEVNYLTQIKGKIPVIKRPKDQLSGKLAKEPSKNKLSLEENCQKYLKSKNNLKSTENLKPTENIKPSSIHKLQKQRKKSKDFPLKKQQDPKDGLKKTLQSSSTEKNGTTTQNCFTKIQIRDRQIQQNINIKPNNELRKKTLQKKSHKNLNSKSIGKKKSQTKILPNK